MQKFVFILIAVMSSSWFAMFASPSEADAAMKIIKGTVTYRARMALPPDAYVIVEARGGEGNVIAETQVQANGHQVPLSYKLDLPASFTATVRAAIYVGGQSRWVSDPVEIAAEHQADASVEIVLKPFKPMALPSTFHCGDTEVSIDIADHHTILKIAGEQIEIVPVPSASGSRFEAPNDPGSFFWNKGSSSLVVSLRGKTLPECVDQPDMTKKRFRARGNEPGWHLEIAGQNIVIVTDYGAKTSEAALPEPASEAGETVYRLEELHMTVRISDAICRDAATGMPHPKTVTVETAERTTLSGCGGEPAELLIGSEWMVEDIIGGGIIDRSHVTIKFGLDQRAAGLASCNRYTASFALTGEGLRFGNAASTMMGCAQSLMTQERKFFDALQSIAGFDVDGTGALLLKTSAGTVALLARRQ